MRWTIVLGWLLAAGFLQAEAPMDLNSPFKKVALVKGKTGEVETREIQQARLVADGVEMKKVDGGVAILPVEDVVAILPVLPQGEDLGTVREIEAVLRLLQDISPELAKQAGLEEKQIQDWKHLRDRVAQTEAQKEEQERQRREAGSEKEFRDWIAQAGELRRPRTEKEITQLRRAGEKLAQSNPARMDAILEVLAALSQVQPKEKGEPLPELSKLTEVQPRLIPDDLLGWLAGGVLILSSFGLLFGLAFLSSSLTRFKEGAWLGGIVFGIVAMGLLGVLSWTWFPAQVTGEAVSPRADAKMEELGLYLKNRARPVYYFPAKEFSFSAEEWRSGLLGYLTVAEEPVGLFKVKMKEGALWMAGSNWVWQQPLTAMGIPLPFRLTLEGKNPDVREWENPAMAGVKLGRWPLPDFLADLVKDSALRVWQRGLSSAGLAGVKLEKNTPGMISITVPASGVRPKYDLAKAEQQKGIAYQREISAEELAKAFMENKGKEFLGKFVVIEGAVEKISSGSEYSGVSLASRGESNLNPEKAPAKIKEDDFDIFYLRGADSYGSRRDPLFIKLVIKSPGVFVRDSYGDVYVGPRANIVKESPLIKKGYRVKFSSEGRVQSDQIQNNEIEIYGINLGANGEGLQCFDPSAQIPK